MNTHDSDKRNEHRSTDTASENAAVDERAPGWELPTDDTGEPDYEAAIEQIGLKYDYLFNIDTDYYRYRGRRGDDVVVAPQSEYTDLKDDCLPVAIVWAAFCEGRVGHGPPLTGPGIVEGVTNKSGNSHIKMGPAASEDSFARINLENVPQEGSVYIDYWNGENLPRLSLYDATGREEPAFEFLLPTSEERRVQMLRDREIYRLETLPEDLREQLDTAGWEPK